MIVPDDVFTRACVTLKVLSDHLLAAAQAAQTLQARLPADSPAEGRLIEELFAINDRVSEMERIFAAIVEEQPPRRDSLATVH